MTDPSPAGQHTLRRHNSALVLRTVLERPGISRATIAAHTGLAKATVSSLVDRLIAADLVAETGLVSRPGRGRRSTGLAPSTTGPHGLGVEIGVDYLATCLVDLTGHPHDHRIRTGDNRTRPAVRVLAAAVRAINAALRDARTRGVSVGGIGIAVPGLVESGTGMLRLAPNLGWRDVDVVTAVRDRIDPPTLPVLLGNEADFAAAAELGGPTSGGPRDFVLVSGEIGIGAGLVVDGRPFPGVRGFSGEIGHLTVDPAGPECACGSRGCLERLAGLDWIMRAADVWAGSGDRPPAEMLAELIRRLTEMDPVAVAAVHAAGRWLGIALASVVNVVDVPCVVLGGSYAELAPWLRDAMAAQLDRRVVSAVWSPVRIISSTLGATAAVLGAGAAPIQAIIADPDAYLAPSA
ncbi:MAG TPA: ROK family transcriptional regulator [Pseudonocardiaceae bacterium]|jgi:predicted NBD/HSP70 family sugar kinase|nr:ROK family transcriptional regulator [Pseudonocardiaceae bacterium]